MFIPLRSDPFSMCKPSQYQSTPINSNHLVIFSTRSSSSSSLQRIINSWPLPATVAPAHGKLHLGASGPRAAFLEPSSWGAVVLKRQWQRFTPSQMLHVEYIYLHNWAICWVNVGINIPAPLSIWALVWTLAAILEEGMPPSNFTRIFEFQWISQRARFERIQRLPLLSQAMGSLHLSVTPY